MLTAYITHPVCRRHDMGASHPEQPARLDAIQNELQSHRLLASLAHHEAPCATIEQLGRVHASAHIQRLQALAPAAGIADIDPDTRMNPYSWQAALRAAGAAVLATDLVMQGGARHAFCAVRPPGHHAESNRGMGFCLFNNIAVAAAHALAAHGLDRVAIVDFDVHFGNGTAEIFEHDSRVLMCQTYQYPLYPGMNPPGVPGHSVYCPLPDGSGGEAFRAAVTDYWLPALEDFQPQMLFVSAGFDAAAGDPLAGLNFVPDDYAWITQTLCEHAAAHCDNRVVATLEGGYNLAELAVCASAHIATLIQADI